MHNDKLDSMRRAQHSRNLGSFLQQSYKTNSQQCLPGFVMFLPRHLWLSRASVRADRHSSARSYAAMTEAPVSPSLGADPLLGHRAFPKP